MVSKYGAHLLPDDSHTLWFVYKLNNTHFPCDTEKDFLREGKGRKFP